MLKLCTNCNQRYAHHSTNSDYVHRCNSGNPNKDNEDHFTTGRNNWNWLGIGNTAEGHNSAVRGTDIDTRTVRGNTKITHLTRQRFQYQKTEMI